MTKFKPKEFAEQAAKDKDELGQLNKTGLYKEGWVRETCFVCLGSGCSGSGGECQVCRGNSVVYRHKKSNVQALYPGGPFV